MLPKLVESIAKSKNITVGKIIADGAYDSNEIFRCLADNGIVPCIKVRRNVRVKKINHILRNLSESYLKEKRFTKMEGQSVSYGKRLIAETVFSCIKRTFDRKYVYSAKIENMVKKMMLKKHHCIINLHLPK